VIQRAADGLYHPSNEAEIAELVRFAGANGRKLRVRGAGHSANSGILTGDPRDVHIGLDRLALVSFDDDKQQATVEAGCTLTGFFRQLDAHGWALPSTAGITHQTVAGFVSTGSSGGSLLHSIGSHVVCVRLVDGCGNVHELRRNGDPDDAFYAAGVSLGLLGVITAVTFQCVERFTIIGSETTSSYADCEIDLFGTGAPEKPGLQEFLGTREHSRLMWFPQPGVERITVWQARRRTTADGPFTRRPYHVFPMVAGSMLPAHLFLNLLLRTLDVINPPEPRTRLRRVMRSLIERFYPALASSFLADGSQHFQDTWWQGLPMDNPVDDRLVPMDFTEMWFPLDRVREVMVELATYYREGGYRHTGSFACEIYGTPGSDFWLSPAYQRDVVKINVFWFARNRGNPATEFFPAIWQRLKPLGYRMHWGKVLSGDTNYLRRQYPRWEDFMLLRARMDPLQVFVSDYWRAQLEI
jgi:FAD binding domain/D-arabinono-1,4-lactone oxidase